MPLILNPTKRTALQPTINTSETTKENRRIFTARRHSPVIG
jgi:hypothetical protein